MVIINRKEEPMNGEPWWALAIGATWTGGYQTIKLILDYRLKTRELDLKEKELEIKKGEG